MKWSYSQLEPTLQEAIRWARITERHLYVVYVRHRQRFFIRKPMPQVAWESFHEVHPDGKVLEIFDLLGEYLWFGPYNEAQEVSGIKEVGLMMNIGGYVYEYCGGCWIYAGRQR